jgi:hypothetical protein
MYSHVNPCSNHSVAFECLDCTTDSLLLHLQLLLQTDARAVLRVSGSHAVSINLTANGLPYITLANAHAYMFHRGLEEWMRVADWGFPASMHHTCSAGATQEDIATLMSAAQRQRPKSAVFEVARTVRILIVCCSVAHVHLHCYAQSVSC